MKNDRGELGLEGMDCDKLRTAGHTFRMNRVKKIRPFCICTACPRKALSARDPFPSTPSSGPCRMSCNSSSIQLNRPFCLTSIPPPLLETALHSNEDPSPTKTAVKLNIFTHSIRLNKLNSTVIYRTCLRR